MTMLQAAKVDARIGAQSLAACKALSKAAQAVEEAASKLQATTTSTEGRIRAPSCKAWQTRAKHLILLVDGL